MKEEDAVVCAERLTVKFRHFTLEEASLSLEKGCVLGVVGKNGAGKTTLFNGILDVVPKSGGQVRIFGKDNRALTPAEKGKLAVVMGDIGIMARCNVRKTSKIMRRVFDEWDERRFFSLCERFELPEKVSYLKMSRGMKLKMQLAVAFSHHAELLILDEPTAGLDPLARIELLELVRSFALDEGAAVLLSSHITSDLEKACDYIAFIDGGRLMPAEEKDALLERYCKVKCTKEQLESLDPEAVAGVRQNAFGAEALVLRKKVSEAFAAEPATLEDIMIFTLSARREQ